MNYLLRRRIRMLVTDPAALFRIINRALGGLAPGIGAGSLAAWPVLIKFYINNRCNASCTMCDVGRGNRNSVLHKQLVGDGNSELDLSTFRRLVAEIAPFRPAVAIAGVEPLLHADIVHMIAAARERALRVQLNTNGILLEPQAADIVRAGVDSIALSIDGPEPIHNAIRGTDSFSRAINGLRAARRAVATLPGPGTALTANLCVTALNHAHVEECAVMMLDQEGVHRFSVTHPYYVTDTAAAAHNDGYAALGSASQSGLRPEQLNGIEPAALWRQICNLKRRFGTRRLRIHPDLSSESRLRDYYRRPERFPGRPRCTAPWTISSVTANGDVFIHNRCFDYCTGNIHRNSFREIWRGAAYGRFRRLLKSHGLSPACARCSGVFHGGTI